MKFNLNFNHTHTHTHTHTLFKGLHTHLIRQVIAPGTSRHWHFKFTKEPPRGPPGNIV